MLRDLNDNMKTVALRLTRETGNIEDCNAILVEARVHESWLSIGYIVKVHIPRVHKALLNNHISNVTIQSRRREHISQINDFVFNCAITITKSGKWEPTNPLYTYNMKL